jgi:predicted acylesterase/phospholipase RssA
MEKHRTQSPRPRGIWLAMSGGGLRAALFHYGALKRLYELDLLEDVTVISATSGGALIAALIVTLSPFERSLRGSLTIHRLEIGRVSSCAQRAFAIQQSFSVT